MQIKKVIIFDIALACLLLCVCLLAGCAIYPPPAAIMETAAPLTAAPTPPTATEAPASPETASPEPETSKEPEGPDYLILVNQAHPIDPAFLERIELVENEGAGGDIDEVEARTLEAFYALRDALAERGVVVAVESAYRSVERQQELMDAFIEAYGEDYARRIAAEPGTSEHHTGLAIDLVPWIDGAWARADADPQKKAAVFEIIHPLLADYGFILRYPKGKEAITGYDYEPWHIRYVGSTEIARELYEQGLTLEEYLSK